MLLADLFRAAHSLKGAARAVDLRDIEAIAHRLEDVLGAVQRGEVAPAAELFDRLFRAVDALRESMAAHLRGESLPAEQREQLLGQLEAALKGELAAAPGLIAPAPARPESDSPSSAPAPRPATAEETIRVATAKLDRLMDGMGELLVARMRTEQRLGELLALQQRLGQWEKTWRQARPLYRRLQRQRPAELSASDNGQEVGPLLDFLAANEVSLATFSADMNKLLRSFASDCGYLTLLTDDLQDEVRQVRMLPIASLFDPLPRMVRDLARERGKEVSLQIEGADTEVDRQVLEMMKDPLVHLLRNAVDHGIEPPAQRETAGKPIRERSICGRRRRATPSSWKWPTMGRASTWQPCGGRRWPRACCQPRRQPVSAPKTPFSTSFAPGCPPGLK